MRGPEKQGLVWIAFFLIQIDNNQLISTHTG
jgi:hypothetical protein